MNGPEYNSQDQEIDREEWTKQMELLTFWYAKDNAENDCIFWINPWSGEAEPICKFVWPIHPPEVTEKIEQLWECIGKEFAACKIPDPELTKKP